MTISSVVKQAALSWLDAGAGTKYQLAKETKVDYASLSRWLDEGTDIRVSTLDNIAVFLGVTAVAPKQPKQSRKK